MGMPAPEIATKAAAEVQIILADFSERLDSGDTITSINSVTVAPTGPTIISSVKNSASTGVLVKLSGGTANTTYTVTTTITTTGGETLCVDGTLRVE